MKGNKDNRRYFFLKLKLFPDRCCVKQGRTSPRVKGRRSENALNLCQTGPHPFQHAS